MVRVNGGALLVPALNYNIRVIEAIGRCDMDLVLAGMHAASAAANTTKKYRSEFDGDDAVITSSAGHGEYSSIEVFVLHRSALFHKQIFFRSDKWNCL